MHQNTADIATNATELTNKVDKTSNESVGGDKTFTGATIFSGTVDLQGGIIGTTTEINSTELVVADANVTINNGGTDVTAEGSGLTVERTGDNNAFNYDSTAPSYWKIDQGAESIEVQGIISDTKANLDALTPKREKLFYYATDESKYYRYDGIELVEVAGGGSGVGSPSIYGLFNAEDGNTVGFTNFGITTTNPISGTQSYEITAYPAQSASVTIQDRNKNKLNKVSLFIKATAGSVDVVVYSDAVEKNRVTYDSSEGLKELVLTFYQDDSLSSYIEIEDNGSAAGVVVDDIVFDDEALNIGTAITTNSVRLEDNNGESITGNVTDIPFNGTGNGWSGSTYTVQSNNSIVSISGNVEFTSNGRRLIGLYKNGTRVKEYVQADVGNGSQTSVNKIDFC